MSQVTLASAAAHDVEIRKSRFLAQAEPVTSPEEALTFLARASDPSATHNCWAWRIGQNYRFSDDGEPASTAGKPILAAIDGQGIDAVMVVVTRWFGGIKLGAGGLVRAYGGSAAECLRRAERRIVIPQVHARLHCGFEHIGTAYALLPDASATKLGERYATDGIELDLHLPQAHFERLATTLRDATRGKARLALLDEPPAPA